MGEGEGTGVGDGIDLAAVSATFWVSICLASCDTTGTAVFLEDNTNKSIAGTTIAAIPITDKINFVFLSIELIKVESQNAKEKNFTLFTLTLTHFTMPPSENNT